MTLAGSDEIQESGWHDIDVESPDPATNRAVGMARPHDNAGHWGPGAAVIDAETKEVLETKNHR